MTQAAIYGDLIRRSACDQDVHEVSFFGFRDDGAHRLPGGAPAGRRHARPAVAAVRAAIAETASGCSGLSVWSPAEDVLGADAELSVASSGMVGAVISAGEEARAKACVTEVAIRDFGGAATSTTPHCLTASVGPGSIALELSLPTGEDAREGLDRLRGRVEPTPDYDRRARSLDSALTILYHAASAYYHPRELNTSSLTSNMCSPSVTNTCSLG